MGIIQSSLANGPVYFNAYPNLQLSLSDVNILDALTLNVKIHGYNYVPGSELICLCYRVCFKLLSTLNPKCKLINNNSEETILIETNFNKSQIITRQPIKRNEIQFPDHWIINKGISSSSHALNITQHDSQIISTPDGQIVLRFDKSNVSSRHSTGSRPSSFRHPYRTFSSKSQFSLTDDNYLPARSKPASLHTIDDNIPSTSHVDHLHINENNIIRPIHNNELDKEIPTESELDFNL
ncbi:hypothetical protein ACH5RR_030368 [Cinchona calisaya]|uniref:Uncharacterized protein n=1 Tax=Cinchona calisaya TaxID=153742 RepID=A0ABD2YXM0_9GENT